MQLNRRDPAAAAVDVPAVAVSPNDGSVGNALKVYSEDR